MAIDPEFATDEIARLTGSPSEYGAVPGGREHFDRWEQDDAVAELSAHIGVPFARCYALIRQEMGPQQDDDAFIGAVARVALAAEQGRVIGLSAEAEAVLSGYEEDAEAEEDRLAELAARVNAPREGSALGRVKGVRIDRHDTKKTGRKQKTGEVHEGDQAEAAENATDKKLRAALKRAHVLGYVHESVSSHGPTSYRNESGKAQS